MEFINGVAHKYNLERFVQKCVYAEKKVIA